MTSDGEAGPAATPRPATASPLLEVAGASKQFGATRALDDVSLLVGPGEIVALLGENGAGKSTLIKALAGVHALDAGSIRYRGQAAADSLPRLPIAFIHQDLGLIEWMTVAENICLALGYPRRLGLVHWPAAREQAARALAAVGADIHPDARVSSLSRTEKSLVAISRALAANVELLVLDEPTASLPADEVARLFASLRRLRAQGVGMIYVSHRLDEVFGIADRIVVLRDGRVVGERMTAGTTAEELILLIVGREPSQIFRRPAQRSGAARLELAGLTIGDVGPIDCQLHAGEMVGLIGLRGAGQESVGRALFGLAPITGGRILLDGKAIIPSSPRAAMGAGIDLVCSDRMTDSLAPNLSVRENLFLNPRAGRRDAPGYIRPGREHADAFRLGHEIGLRPNDPELPIEWLSGGNQQKVVLGRWLHLQGKVYIFEDPTAGVDVGAKVEIYRLFDVALKRGAAIVLVSTDFEEVEKVCHRALVFDRGRVVAELGIGDISAENLLAAASASIGPVSAALNECHCEERSDETASSGKARGSVVRCSTEIASSLRSAQ
ncbi:MAG TPA: sugar ABC transporter ATP-binding protein [Acetobacteraceae bacterium]|nr:sugar ABC transporter ATP-binding protein [Acetobacteraceae bacterium]